MKNEKTTDYSKYILSIREYILYGMAFMTGSVVALYLLFGVWWTGIAAGCLFLPVFYRKLSEYLKRRRIAVLEEEFCVYMQLTAASLAGGCSLENVFREVAESGVTAGGNSIMEKEYYAIDRLIRLRYDSRDAFARFADRSGSKDIKSISAALSCTAETGGNLVSLMRGGVAALRLKQDTEREMKRITSLPRMNHRILTVMPFAFIMLLKTMSPEYISCLYTWPGVTVMGLVAMLLTAAWLLGEHIGKTVL